MSWRRRLAELTVAGGLTAAGCVKQPSFVCNANPDPCCWGESDPECAAETACTDAPSPACCVDMRYALQGGPRLPGSPLADLQAACESVVDEADNCSVSSTPGCCEVVQDAGERNDSPCCSDPNGAVCLELKECLAEPSPACCESLTMIPRAVLPYGVPDPCLTITGNLDTCGVPTPECCANGADAGMAPPLCPADGGSAEDGGSQDGGADGGS